MLSGVCPGLLSYSSRERSSTADWDAGSNQRRASNGREGHPNVLDVINAGLVDCVINTPEGGRSTAMKDGFQIRRAAAERRIPCFTSIDTARAATEALLAGSQTYDVRPINEYRSGGSTA